MAYLSISIENEKYVAENMLCGKLFAVKTDQSTEKEQFGDAIKRIRAEKGMSLTQVRDNSGGELATSYISNIENNRIKPEVISPAKLKSIAKGLQVEEEWIFSFVRGVPPDKRKLVDEKFDTLAHKFSLLSGDAREKAEYLLRVLDRELHRMVLEELRRQEHRDRFTGEF